MTVIYRNRLTGKIEREQIYGEAALKFLYGDSFLSRLFSTSLLTLICKTPLFSRFYGWIQSRPGSKKKVKPFITEYGIDSSEFLKPVESFTSFNDFFTRELKANARPIAADEDVAIIPADGRYLAFQNIAETDGFFVKGEKFDLATLIGDQALAARYASGTMILGRLCPTDYHRFHFPTDCTPQETKLINGWLFSVNPVALKRNCRTLQENKRCYTLLETENFGSILYMEVGATSVGTIVETFSPKNTYRKGDEKGYFSFGGSFLVILFEPGRITLDEDLAQTSSDKIELRCLLGQSMGTAK